MSDTAYDDDGVDHSDAYDTNPGEQGKWISAIIALAGLWLIGEAVFVDLLLEDTVGLGIEDFWNDLLVGVALTVLGGYNYSRRTNETLGSAGAAGLAALLGLWLIVSPIALGIRSNIFQTAPELGFWHDVIVGLVVFVVSVYSVYKTRTVDVATPTPD
jgi:hypothetical protein